MTALAIVLGIIAVILTLWLVLIPFGMVASSFTAFSHRGHDWKHWRRQS